MSHVKNLILGVHLDFQIIWKTPWSIVEALFLLDKQFSFFEAFLLFVMRGVHCNGSVHPALSALNIFFLLHLHGKVLVLTD
jgi:hypothetical protein